MGKIGLQRECVMNKHAQILPRLHQYQRGVQYQPVHSNTYTV